MSDSSKSIQITNFQKTLLIITSLVLACLFFAFKISVADSNSLDQLARRSIDPEVALSNGRPTIFEFYADWCEVCQEMAPSMLMAEQDNKNKLDIVLLNVENERWLDLIDKYEVNGIPQLNLFDKDGNNLGKSVGLKSSDDIKNIIEFLTINKETPGILSINKIGNKSIIDYPDNNVNYNLVNPMSHG